MGTRMLSVEVCSAPGTGEECGSCLACGLAELTKRVRLLERQVAGHEERLADLDQVLRPAAPKGGSHG